MSLPVEGWAVEQNGAILMATVSDTERAAKVNWLGVRAGVVVMNWWSDERIAETFAHLTANHDAGAALVRVRVERINNG